VKLLRRHPQIGFLVPGFIIYTSLMIVPLIFAVYYSFFDWSGIGPMSFIGFDNYRSLFTDPRLSGIFWNALGNNVKFVLCVLGIIMPIQLLIAYTIDLKVTGYRAFQLIVFLPYVVSPTIIGFFAILVFDPNLGLLNTIFELIGQAQWKSAWFGNPKIAFPVMVGVIAWQGIGAGMLIFLANLKEISREILEASIIDGASRWRRFVHIIIPALVPSFTNNIVLGTIWAMVQFDIPYIVGGPQGGVDNSVDFMNLFFYRFAFGGSYYGETAMGFGATISVVLFAIILVVAVIQIKFLTRFERD
jgi:raffinose/stachyose/melibiose transport system permease protein